ncbi:MAG: polymer-forming cytoskeletal protein [Actinomycetota bacterium]|nr:polymer-forming cytoskeletal protein [Actinomycetota bacterium]
MVEDDVHSGFGDVLVIGKVKGDIEAGFGDVYVNAPVKGEVHVGWGDVDLGPDGEILGNLECEGCEITGNRDAVEGHITARGMALDFDESHGHGIIGFVGWLFAALAFAACAVLAAVVAPRPLASAASRAEESPGRSFVYGLVSLPVFFVLCVVLAVTIIGIPLLLLLVPAYLALLFVGALVAAFFIGTRILMFTGRYRVGNALAAVVGAMILAATTLIPVLGNLLLYALTLLGTGAIILALFSRRRPRASHSSYEAYVRDRSGG